MVWHTRVIMAFSQDRSGETAEAETAMREILRECPVAKVRANLLTGFANLILQRHSDDDREVKDLQIALTEVIDGGSLDSETIGRAMLQLAQCQWVLRAHDDARRTVSASKALLVRSNSILLPVVARIEAAYREGDDDR